MKNQYQNTEQDRRLQWLEDKFTIMNEELGGIKSSMSSMCADLKWLKKLVWIIVGGVIATFISTWMN